MRLTPSLTAALFTAPLFCAPALAQTVPQCPAGQVIPSEYDAWSQPSDVDTSTNAANAAFIETEIAYTAALIETPQVTFAKATPRVTPRGSYSGLLRLTIPDTGNYAIAAGSAIWIDLIHDKAAMVATSHGHGPDCSGIRKIVNFTLQAGDYVVQLAGGQTRTVTLLIRPTP